MISVEVNIVRRTFSVISDRGSGVLSMPKEKVTVFEALAMAGDIGDFGDRSKVRIVREIEGQTKVMTFDLRSEDIINSEYYYIEPNDVIYIQKIKGQSFGINSAATTVSVVATTLAFGGFVYALVARIMNAVGEGGTK
jgi:polysaccharide export outer membrane protein